MKSGAFKSRQDFYSLNQLITLDATFTKLFGIPSASLFRKMLIGKLEDPVLLVQNQADEKVDYIQILKAVAHLIHFEETSSISNFN
jgi:hypothetical protein